MVERPAHADARRSLPSVEQVAGALARNSPGLPRGLLVQLAREAVDAARAEAAAGIRIDHDAVVDVARRHAESTTHRLLRPVLNATGVLAHTNLGRAPLSEETLRAVAAVATAYSNLEFRLDEGRRGSRHEHAGALLARACGAEAGLVVNNNAAAVLVVLAALARGHDVVVSRGELVEIGGGFRVPEVMAESGARLVEVGTTNRTRLSDYERAVHDGTALLLKVHTSNYRMVGFVETVGVAELAGLGPPVAVDAGSGLLDAHTPWLPDGRPPWLGDEPGVRQCLEAGAALVTFSGDKLLGGPQAGVVVGRADLVAAVARHPLARAVRADKMTLAALQHVALAYLSGDATAIPLWRLATTPVGELRARAVHLAEQVAGAVAVDTEAAAGGGSLPGLTIPSAGVAVDAPGARGQALLAALRDEGVVARLERGRVVCDLRAVAPEDDRRLADALAAATGRVEAMTGR